MNFSKLASRAVPYGEKFQPRKGTRITRVIVHHWAGTGDGGINTLTNPNNEVSANYIITSRGEIIGQVPEPLRAWTSGGWEIDAQSITIEVQNSTGAPEWRVSDAAFEALVKLVADVANRYNFAPLRNGVEIRKHRDWAPRRTCPGPYLESRLDELARRAQELRGGKPAPAPAAAAPSHSGANVPQLVQEVWDGRHGNGEQRRQSLARHGNWVPIAVQAVIDWQIDSGMPAVSGGANVMQLVQEVWDGRHGNGEQRRQSLARHGNWVPIAVQAVIDWQIETGQV